MGKDADLQNLVRAETAGAVVQSGSIQHLTMQTALPAAGAVVPRQVPLAVRDFVGRDAELELLDAWLAGRDDHGAAKVVTVVGTAGVGKTTLAVRWANRTRDHFPDGQFFVDLRGFDPVVSPADPATVLDDFLRVLGVVPDRIPDRLEAKSGMFRSLLDGRRMLIVLDNAATAVQIRSFLPGSASTAVLITSRDRLTGLSALNGARRVSLDPLPQEDAVTLLRRIAGDRLADVAPDVVVGLARYCAHLPLPLRIMAEHVAISHSTPAEFVRELTGHDSRLDVVSLDEEPARLRSVFTSSYRKLREEDARLFRLLSLYPGDAVSTEAAAALAGTGIRLAAASLARLTEASLVDCPRRNHVVMHDLLREFAAERAEHDDTREARQRATLRFLDWYLHSWDHADRVLDPNRRRLPLSPPAEGTPHLEFDDLVSAFAWCEAERTTLVAAILFAAGNGHGVHAWQLTWCAWTFFDRGKHWRDWITTHTTALAVTRESGDRFAESRILTGLALAYQHRRQHPEALDCLTRSLHITRDLGDRYYEAVNLYCLGGALLVDGDTEAALARFGQALALREEIADRHGESLTLAAIGRALRATDRIDEAILYFERSLVIRRALHDRHGEGTTLNNLGEAHLTRGRYSHATHYLRQALDIRREVQDRWGVARTLRHLGQALLSAGQPIADVVEHWTEALETFNALGDDPQSEAVRDMLRALVDANTPTEPPRAANHHLANRETQPDPQERTL